MHEFHALDREKLLVSRPNALNEWKPQAGLARKELPEAGEPAATRGARLAQMRRLAQEFTGHETDSAGRRYDLRLLPAPIFKMRFLRHGSGVQWQKQRGPVKIESGTEVASRGRTWRMATPLV